VVRESVTSTNGFYVDVYWIAHYYVTQARRDEFRSLLPASVGLQIWEDATPLGYASESSDSKIQLIQPITRALSRQHRYIINDKLLHYDVFLNFEDDMIVRGPHVHHYLNKTNELYRLRQGAPKILTNPDGIGKPALTSWEFGKNAESNESDYPRLSRTARRKQRQTVQRECQVYYW
jgi:hypothetical protein